MPVRSLTRRDRAVIAAAVAICAAAVAMTLQSTPPLADYPASFASPSPAADDTPAPAGPGLAETAHRTLVRATADEQAKVTSVVRGGILLPYGGTSGRFVQVMTPCEYRGWVNIRDLRLYQRARTQARSLAEATVVLDPGHGGTESGAVGRGGLDEKDVNLDIVRRTAAALRPARVLVTRDGDFVAGLVYRTRIAAAVGAQIFVSVHNNSNADTGSEQPGTETYYQRDSDLSKRLAGLTYEELSGALRRFPVSWVSARDAGAKYRTNERGTDYYGVLRTSVVPAVITEGAYIDNPPEEALLRRADVRDLMARALAHAIERYFTTHDPGSGYVTKPLPRATGPRYRLPSTCRDPA